MKNGLISVTQFQKKIILFLLTKISSQTFQHFTFQLWDESLRQRRQTSSFESTWKRQPRKTRKTKWNERVKSWKISLLNSSLFRCFAFFFFLAFKYFFLFSLFNPKATFLCFSSETFARLELRDTLWVV